ncbi:MAG: riboflavin biosynthesis protein RibD [Micrococcales bacterium 73-13]|nr:MAG: riboflavin biosynthesis protein RibD [Micrococcales bacterium 73-13]
MDADARIVAAMRRTLELAARGPLTGGNPQVGCVLLDADERPIAEGWHRGAGTPHAEVDALSRAPEGAAHTAVVTLEPCAHTGRTGPCAEALAAAGIRRVVYAVDDPGPEAGGGAERLRAAGVEVVSGVLADEADALLGPWLTAARRARPWVTVKWAATIDGRAAAADGTSRWITGPDARRDGHRLRAESDAILTGTGTVLADDPALTARDDDGALLPHQPLPVVVGARPVPAGAALRRHPAGLVEAGDRPLAEVLDELWRRGAARVLVEAGPRLTTSILREGLADELAVYLAPKLLGGPATAIGDLGIAAIGDAIDLELREVRRLGPDLALALRSAPADREPGGVGVRHAREGRAAPEDGRGR